MSGRPLMNELSPPFIFHLTNSTTGGAGIAARRLNAALNKAQITSTLITLPKGQNTALQNSKFLKRTLTERVKSFIFAQLASRYSVRTYFTFWSSGNKNLRNYLKDIDPATSIIHIHNWFNILDYNLLKDILASKCQVVITIHDQRFLTGGCHAAITCRGFETGCLNCPEQSQLLGIKIRNNFSALRKVMQHSENLTIVSPSKWLLNELDKSPITRTTNAIHIPNTMESFFQDIDLTSTPERIGERQINIGVASMDIKSYLKGGDYVLDLEKEISKLQLPYKIFYLRDFENNPNDFWINLDCLLVPSRGDNSPNVIHEAKYFGLPVIAVKVGGITELLDDNFDFGIALTALNVDTLLLAIASLSKENLTIAKRVAIRNSYLFALGNPLEKYVNLYKSLISSH
jgi:hypothetical protein